MASQYNLELKGILDLKQVKQELEKLRSLQYSITGNNRSNVTGTSQNFSNLSKLNSTLTRITSLLSQLNTNISKLNVFNKQINTTNVASRSNIPLYSIPLSGVKSNKIEANEVLWDNKGNISRIRNITQTSSQPIQNNPFRTQQISSQNVTSRNIPTSLNKTQNQEPWYKSSLVQSMGGLAFGAVTDQLVRLSEIQGWGDTSVGRILGQDITIGGIANIIGKAGSSALMGASVGGLSGVGVGAVPGAVIGGVVGVVQGTIENAVRSTELFTQALNEASTRVNQAFVINKNINTFFENKRDTEAVKKQDLAYLKKELDIADKEYNEAHSFIKHIIGIDNLPDYEAETKRMIASKEYKLSDWQIKHRIQTADQYKQNYSTMVEADTRRTKIQSSIDAINNSNKAIEEKRLTDQKNKEEKERALIEQQNNIRSNLNQSIDDEKYNYARFNELKHLQNYINSNDEDTIRKLISNYTDKAESSKSSYVGLLNDARTTDDIELKELLLKQARAKKDEWNFASTQVGNLNSALQNILIEPLQERLSRLTAPDMSNVNSLAGQGVMINRADDNSKQESLLNYQKQQTQLQEEIKKLLKDNSFTSTIM